jgi:hypothetical protein
MAILGRKVPVPLHLLLGLSAEATREGDEAVVRLQGQLGDSARVFHGVAADWTDGGVELTVLASLVPWKRRGSPEFDTTVRVRAPAGPVVVRYREPDGSTVPLPTDGAGGPG